METFYYLEKAFFSLSFEEHKRFDKFLRSSYFLKRHRHNSPLHKFYRLLKGEIIPKSLAINYRLNKTKSSIHHVNRIIDTSSLIKKIYPDKFLDCNKQFIKLCSELLSYFLDFLSVESFLRDSVYYKISILNELNNRNLDDFFRHYCKEDRFDELNCISKETQQAYFVWKLVQTLNIHKEKKIKLSPCVDIVKETHIDYDVEKQMLKNFLKKELTSLLSRKQVTNHI